MCACACVYVVTPQRAKLSFNGKTSDRNIRRRERRGGVGSKINSHYIVASRCAPPRRYGRGYNRRENSPLRRKTRNIYIPRGARQRCACVTSLAREERGRRKKNRRETRDNVGVNGYFPRPRFGRCARAHGARFVDSSTFRVSAISRGGTPRARLKSERFNEQRA